MKGLIILRRLLNEELIYPQDISDSSIKKLVFLISENFYCHPRVLAEASLVMLNLFLYDEES